MIGAGDGLQQQYGRGAVEPLDEALDDTEREMARLFGTVDAMIATAHDSETSAALAANAPPTT